MNTNGGFASQPFLSFAAGKPETRQDASSGEKDRLVPPTWKPMASRHTREPKTAHGKRPSCISAEVTNGLESSSQSQLSFFESRLRNRGFHLGALRPVFQLVFSLKPTFLGPSNSTSHWRTFHLQAVFARHLDREIDLHRLPESLLMQFTCTSRAGSPPALSAS